MHTYIHTYIQDMHGYYKSTRSELRRYREFINNQMNIQIMQVSQFFYEQRIALEELACDLDEVESRDSLY